MVSMPGWMDCSSDWLDYSLAKSASSLDLSGYMMVMLASSLAKSDCNLFRHMDLPQFPSFQILPMVSLASNLDLLGCMMVMSVNNSEKWDCRMVKSASN